MKSYKFEKKNNSKNNNENYLSDSLDKNSIRINKFISNAGVCSRREADILIQKGKIKVNGKVCENVGLKISLDDEVTYNSKILYPEEKVYIAFNKPKNCITTLKDNKERETVMKHLKGACRERIYPIGRLDRETTGVLLFTNDGELAKGLSHPSFEIKKVYNVFLDKELVRQDLEKIKSGVVLKDGKVKVDDIFIDRLDQKEVGIEIHSGKNRIIRRLFEHLGYKVMRLDRTLFGDISKKKMPRGSWRHLDKYEIINLKKLLNKKTKGSENSDIRVNKKFSID